MYLKKRTFRFTDTNTIIKTESSMDTFIVGRKVRRFKGNYIFNKNVDIKFSAHTTFME